MEFHKTVIFPGYPAPIVFDDGRGRLLTTHEWGMLPRGERDRSFRKKYSTFNARADKVSQSKVYSPAWFDSNRCVIPTAAFVEWIGETGSKTPIQISDPNENMLFIAGIWDETGSSGMSLSSFTMITCEPNEFISGGSPFGQIHNRMPVILSYDDADVWLDRKTNPDQAMTLLRPFEGDLEAIAVGKT